MILENSITSLSKGKVLQNTKPRIKKKISRESHLVSITGAWTNQKNIALSFYSSQQAGVAESANAIDYTVVAGSLSFKNCHHIQLSTHDIGYFAVMTHNKKGLVSAFSRDQKQWSRTHKMLKFGKANGVVVSDFQINGFYLMFTGGCKVQIATSQDLQKWNLESNPILDIPVASDQCVEIDLVKKVQRGLLVNYRLIEGSKHTVHLALLSSHDPRKVIWRSSKPIWETAPEWGDCKFGASTIYHSQIYSFWNTSQKGLMQVRYPVEGIPFQLPKDHRISLDKAHSNPVIFPRAHFSWEAFATYNPAAFQADGRIHILYRAQGADLISSIGYASSKDGIHIDERSDEPVFLPQEVFDSFQKVSPSDVEQKYISGGGIAGCEDPRVTLIDDRLYMTYVAFDGASPPRVALTSILLADLLAKRWLWERPVLISPPGVVDKSAVIFPEKINGQYVIMHRIFPNILIDFVDDLQFDGTRWLKNKKQICIRDGMWDSRKIGAGAPPIKTSEGWLLIYYGVDDRDDRFYKMGAMLLDLEDPSKVLYRSSTPILEPEDWYENSGFKPGIVYPCGAVVMEGKLLVYYGGADCVVCAASQDLNRFLEALKSNSELQLENVRAQELGIYAAYAKQIKPYFDTHPFQRVGKLRRFQWQPPKLERPRTSFLPRDF